MLAQAIRSQVKSPWRDPKAKVLPRYTLAILYDGKEKLPPSEPQSLRHFGRVAERLGLGVELITRKDLDRLPEYDALWIRETTNIDHHTFRFAKRAEQEGMPVIDDPTSIVRCTNKVYLAELMAANDVATPKTVIISSVRELRGARAAAELSDGPQDTRRVLLARRQPGGQPGANSSAACAACSRIRISFWPRSSCPPTMTGASACWTASRSS